MADDIYRKHRLEQVLDSMVTEEERNMRRAIRLKLALADL
jgi:hypothetical protein